MKETLLTGLLLINAATATADDAFEIISLQFKSEVSLEQQQQAMSSLNDIVKEFSGFKSRDYFYSQENGRWIDLVVWSDINLAKQASADVMQNPAAGAVFSLMDENSMIFSYYSRVDGIQAKLMSAPSEKAASTQ